MTEGILVFLLVVFSLQAAYAARAHGSTRMGPVDFYESSQESNGQDQDKNSKETKPRDRMEDRGCCVLKKSKYKPEWDYLR
jgi:hypothetical protein